jgi:hypothetical protein
VLDQAVEVVVDGLELLLDDGEHGANARLDLRQDCLAEPVALGGVEFDELTPSRQQVGQGRRLLVGKRAERRVDARAEAGNHRGIDGVGLGQDPDPPGRSRGPGGG